MKFYYAIIIKPLLSITIQYNYCKINEVVLSTSYYLLAVAVALKIYLSSSRKKKQHFFAGKTISMKFPSHTLKIVSFLNIM